MRRSVKECVHCGKQIDSGDYRRATTCPLTGHRHELRTLFVDIDYTEVR